jgi:hypothetical protein
VNDLHRAYTAGFNQMSFRKEINRRITHCGIVAVIFAKDRLDGLSHLG